MWSWLDRQDFWPIASRTPMDEFSFPLQSGGLGSLVESTHHAYEDHNHGRYHTRSAAEMVGDDGSAVVDPLDD